MNYEDRITKSYLEDALANAGLKIVTGTYVGDGAASRVIELGFTPRAVFVCRGDGQTHCAEYFSPTSYCGGLALPDNPIVASLGSS